MTDLVLEALQQIAPVARGQLDLGRRTLRWIESGTGAPTVVLIAGRNDTALSWGPVLAALAGRAHAVAYDRAGLGDSDPDTQAILAERSVADLSRLIDAVGGGPCVVAGHSYGGLLALLLAASRPDQLAGLVLVDPALPAIVDWLPRPLRRVLGWTTRAWPLVRYATGRHRPLTRRVARAAAASFSDDPRVQALVTRAYLASADWPHVLASYREGLGIRASEPALARALAAPPEPRIPTVVISATEGRPAWIRRRWTAGQAQLAADRGAAYIVAEGSGHAVPLDRPALVADAIIACRR
jgi:pimeloyl-ACP methyl ester carboxylesterase